MELDDHLFRHESGRMVATLTRIFGPHNHALAEDVVQDAFCRALEVWKFRGAPENPSAWLMATAKNRALDVLRRERTALTLAPELGRLLENDAALIPAFEQLFAPYAVQDDELRMIFSCCHPRLPEEAQVALVLNLLCGFNAREIAAAFLSGEASIEKRISRAKKVLAGSKQLFELTGDQDFLTRLSAVERALYLLFNEGYHGACAQAAMRAELCQEAMRLAALLRNHPLAATPSTHALCALMCFHAARLPARVGPEGNLRSLFHQDRSRWNADLIAEGKLLLDLSAAGHNLSGYHLEAAIACRHSEARSLEETDWPAIVALYDTLLKIRPSPVVALNRAIAVAQHAGPERGLVEIQRITDLDRLANYPFYPATVAELELRSGRKEAAREHFRTALSLARNPMERHFFEQRARDCEQLTTDS